MNRDELLKVAGEPVAWLWKHVLNLTGEAINEGVSRSRVDPTNNTFWNETTSTVVERVYTEAQLLAMYAAGAADMKERATRVKREIRYAGESDYYRVEVYHEGYDEGWNDCVDAISALPITPTNTEG